ncbi:hypothetical protein [Cereibacter sphaeroides]|uniref:hypothetical protein n=1 Tax=Cereibacter sphaeroides TaxID=1063 RepID=UPI000F543565|nr:hypothetical protein [Cereibacter sphaeroides]
MVDLVDIAANNLSAVASLVSAMLAAAVAVLVLVLNQAYARRQQRVQFLQPKLEELYLLLNDVTERNVRIFKLLAGTVAGDLASKSKLNQMDDLNAYGLLTAKKMIMLVRLYFPELTRIHQLLFAAERELSQKIWSLSVGEPVSLEEILDASGRVGHMSSLMEKEMVVNQGRLLKASFLPAWYRRSSQREVQNVPPPPAGPPMTFKHGPSGPIFENAWSCSPDRL